MVSLERALQIIDSTPAEEGITNTYLRGVSILCEASRRANMPWRNRQNRLEVGSVDDTLPNMEESHVRELARYGWIIGASGTWMHPLNREQYWDGLREKLGISEGEWNALTPAINGEYQWGEPVGREFDADEPDVTSGPAKALDAARYVHGGLWAGVQALMEDDQWAEAIIRVGAMRELEKEFDL